MKKLLTILAASFFVLSAYTFARSEECANPFPEFVAKVTEVEGNTVRPLTPQELAYLLDKKGPPPVDGPYEIAIASAPPFGMLVIVQDDCVGKVIGPLPLPAIKLLIGEVES